MKTTIFIILCTVLSSCTQNSEQEEFKFDNFKNTPLWELAQAVRADDADQVKSIIQLRKSNIDYQDPMYKQTLLTLAIENDKKQAFQELLNNGANPNQFVGIENDSSPLLYAVRDIENCDLFYAKNVLKHNANPNLEIKNLHPEMFFSDSYPLLIAILNKNNDGKECLDMVKLLVENGADINCCYKQSFSNICEGVISECIKFKCMEMLRYFVIEKKIVVPKVVYEEGGHGEVPSTYYSLSEILNTNKFKFEKLPELRKFKDEILEYLKTR